jgi:hypothetical protein
LPIIKFVELNEETLTFVDIVVDINVALLNRKTEGRINGYVGDRTSIKRKLALKCL